MEESIPRKSQITIRQLLNLTDGIEGASRLHRDSIRDRNAMAFELPMVAQPGSAFIYGPSHLQIFCELLRRKLNGRSRTFSYFKNACLGPARIGNQIQTRRSGQSTPCQRVLTCARGNGRAWGSWSLDTAIINGRQVFSADLLREAFTGSNANPSYGLTFWLNRPAGPRPRDGHGEDARSALAARVMAGVCICKDAPADMVVGLGSAYQRLFIIPS